MTEVNSFLEEGGKSYPDALQAIIEFRRQVQGRCRAAVEKHLKDHAESMGITLKRNMITTYGEPDWLSTTRYDGKYASVGVQIILKNNDCTLYYCLVWERDDESRLGALVQLYFKNQSDGQRVWDAIKPISGEEWESDEPRSVLIYRDVTPSGICDLEKKMEENLEDWNRVWKQVGGLPKFLTK